MTKRRYWLMKSEPTAYSFNDLLQESAQTAEWDGVRNYQARNILRDQMKLDDGVLFYHSGIQPPAVIGEARVVREGYPVFTAWDPGSDHPDPKSTVENPVWYMVDIKADQYFDKPVTLQAMRNNPALKDMVLLRKRMRLSIQPVTQEQFETICGMGNDN